MLLKRNVADFVSLNCYSTSAHKINEGPCILSKIWQYFTTVTINLEYTGCKKYAAFKEHSGVRNISGVVFQ